MLDAVHEHVYVHLLEPAVTEDVVQVIEQDQRYLRWYVPAMPAGWRL